MVYNIFAAFSLPISTCLPFFDLFFHCPLASCKCPVPLFPLPCWSIFLASILCVFQFLLSLLIYIMLWKRKLWWLSMRKLSAIPFSSSAFVVFSLVCYGCRVLGMFTSCHFCWHTITPFWAVLVISVFWGLCSMEGKLLFLMQCTARVHEIQLKIWLLFCRPRN